MPIQLKRIYEPPDRADGLRILVERLWPRGVKKEAACIDHWCKELAPSTELRKWYGHVPARWVEFRRRYRAELTLHSKELSELVKRCDAAPATTFVFAARDVARNSAVVLREAVEAASGDGSAVHRRDIDCLKD